MKHPALLLIAALPFLAHAQQGTLWGDETRIGVGVAAGFTPEYVGSKDYRFTAVPNLNISRGIFFADLRRGVGVQYRNDRGFAARTSIAYDPGRGVKRQLLRPGSRRLEGMGKIDASAVWNITLALEITPWLGINGEANIHLGGQEDRGNDFRIGMESKVFGNGRDTIKLDANAHIGDGDYNQTYFGVSPAQAVASGYRFHSPGSGVYGVSAGIGWERQLDANWAIGANARLMQLTGDVAKSPIVERKTSATVLATVRYSFR